MEWDVAVFGKAVTAAVVEKVAAVVERVAVVADGDGFAIDCAAGFVEKDDYIKYKNISYS